MTIRRTIHTIEFPYKRKIVLLMLQVLKIDGNSAQTIDCKQIKLFGTSLDKEFPQKKKEFLTIF